MGRVARRRAWLFASIVSIHVTAFAQDLALTKEFLGLAPPGTSTELRFTIVNNAGTFVSDINFTDDLDATLSGLQATGPIPLGPCGLGSSLTLGSVITLSDGQLADGDSCSLTLRVLVPAGATPGTYVNTTSEITGRAGETIVTGPPATDTLFAIAGPSLLKEFGASTIEDGGTVELTFTVGNFNSTLALQDLAFDDDLEAFLPGTIATPTVQTDVCGSGSTLTANDTGSGIVLELRGGQLPAADGSVPVCEFSVTLQLPAAIAPGVYENRTTPVTGTLVGGAAPLAVEGNFAVDSVNHALTPEFSKAFSGPVPPGGSVDLSFTIDASALAVSLTGLGFTDDLDAMLPGTTVERVPLGACGGAVSRGSGSISFNSSGLAAGDTCTFTIGLGIDAGAAPGLYDNVTSMLFVQTASGNAAAEPAVATLEVFGLPPEDAPSPSAPPPRPVPTMGALGPTAWIVLVFLILGVALRARY